MFRSIYALPSFLLVSGCSGAAIEPMTDTSDQAASEEKMTFTLPGFDETLLVSDGTTMKIVRVGARSSKTTVEGAPRALPVAGRSFGGTFRVLTADGALLTVDPKRAAVTATAQTGIKDGADIDIESASVAYVSTRTSGKLHKIDPATGRVLATRDVARGSGVSLRNMLRVGNRIVVEVQRTSRSRPSRGAVAVVDAAKLEVVKLVELEIADPADPSKKLVGVHPDGPMIKDGDRVFVTAKGARPSNTGMLLRLNLASLSLDPWVEPASSGFQGPISIGPKRDMFIAYHTSTPVASTHLFHYQLDANGDPQPRGGGALLDVFEEVEAFPANTDGTLFALPVSCPAGFCIGGAGISFVGTDGAVHPRLGAQELGMKPAFVLFQ
jgi:hypothetical protein